ncbi:MAG: glucan biosynthesis protein [Bdellovibrionaceae bacterium]|nr:glucan biosynthesis protein [Bdellovibrio sp.]
MKTELRSLLTVLATISAFSPLQARVAALPITISKMNLELLKQEAFKQCQKPFNIPVITSIPVLDPPKDGRPESEGMVYQEELEVRTTNLLDTNQFYFSPRPRLTVNTLPMNIYVDRDQSGNYELKSWADANPDYSSPLIRPPIDKSSIPMAGQVLTEIIVGHLSPKGDYPQLFDIRSSAYVRFAGFPPQITGASLRLGAHRIFSQGVNGKSEKSKEDFPIIRSIYISAPSQTKAVALVLLESELFCGALSLEMSPQKEKAEITIDSHWYTREDFNWKNDPHTGLVAYSSMFWKKQNVENGAMRSAAHDSDMLTVNYANGLQKRIAIDPPKTGLSIQDLGTHQTQATSWILANEDRNPSHYVDFKPALGNTNYDLRASYSVNILESNIKTGIRLYQLAADGEYGDNIVAVSTIEQDIPQAKNANQSVHFKYKTTAFYPTQTDDCEFIRQKLSGLPASGGVIDIPEGIFNCTSKIVIKKSHVKFRGAGEKLTTLRLADQSPAPVLVIGDDKVIQDTNGNWITAIRVSDVEVSDLTVDGNLANQDPKKECGNGICDGDVTNIRNNAITIRGASYVSLNHVTAHSAISGGLVTEKYCDHLHIKDFTSYGNFFDGFAGYQTTDSLFESVNLSRNKGAGISIDIQFDNNTFSGGLLASNGDVGIFARNLSGNTFKNLKISHSGSHGAFFAEAEGPNSCANNNEFQSITVENSKGYGIVIASPCTGNKITGASLFKENSSGCYQVNPATKMSVSPETICLK